MLEKHYLLPQNTGNLTPEPLPYKERAILKTLSWKERGHDYTCSRILTSFLNKARDNNRKCAINYESTEIKYMILWELIQDFQFNIT
ncbi:MAG: hypothetical protein AAF349_16880 [Cyanobacteria bacterium P01_A01_bin.68]